jgi:hypothetical protein
MTWTLSHRADADVVPLADRHYNRQHVGAPQFCPPGPAIVFKIKAAGVVKAFWCSANPDARYVKHAWAGAWMCTAFRNEGAGLSSELIRQAVAMTRAVAADKASWQFGNVPPLGMITFVDADKTRKKRDPVRCYRRAGFRHVGFTEGGLWAFQLLPCDMPEPTWAPSPGLFAMMGGPQ